MNLCEMKDVSKGYLRAGQRIEALRGFSMQLIAGKVTGLLGPNGAGKTTAIKVLLSVALPDRGHLLWRGERVRDQRHLGKVGALLEGRGALNERLSTWENANYFCALRETLFDKAHYAELVDRLGLPDPRAPVRLLSTGNKLKSALLLCLIHKPALVVLDEPTIGLDLFGTEQLESLVRHVADAGAAVLLSSHDLAFVERLAQRIVCIRRGEKAFDGPKEAFLQVDHAYIVELQCDHGALPTAPNLSWRHTADGTAQLLVANYAVLCDIMSALVPVLPRAGGLQVRQVTLQQKYRELVDVSEERR